MTEHITKTVPVRQVTFGPKFHFFGYYEKSPWDATGRYLLALEVDFIGRTPEPDDVARVCLIDLENDDKVKVVGETTAWNWQQGSMLQWLGCAPDRDIIHNARDGGRFFSIITDIHSGEARQLPLPVYGLSRDGAWAVSANFARIHDVRPGYGYSPPDPRKDIPCPDDEGVEWMNLRTGEHKRIATYADVAAIAHTPEMDAPGVRHWFNHLQVNNDGSRFALLHRFHRLDGRSGWYTRLLTMNPDGSDVRLLSDHEMVSHYDWRDPGHVFAWAKRDEAGSHYFDFDDATGEFRAVAPDVLTCDGHCSFSPDGRWLLTDTYPQDDHRTLLLVKWPDGPRIDIGRFHSPPEPEFQGEFRCDLHPRWNRDGSQVCIDSAHVDGRQMHMLDVSEIVGS
jgi:hypothetical protein